MNRLMAFALENMNVTPSQFWKLPPFVIINQMLIKAYDPEKDNDMSRKVVVDMMRGIHS